MQGSIFIKGVNRVTLRSIVLISLFLVKFLFLFFYCCWRIIILKICAENKFVLRSVDLEITKVNFSGKVQKCMSHGQKLKIN